MPLNEHEKKKKKKKREISYLFDLNRQIDLKIQWIPILKSKRY